MARFKVGDRARIVGCKSGLYSELSGRECTVRGVGEFVGSKTGALFPYMVEVDGEEAPKLAADDELEPIIDPGSWAAIESVTGWQPERELA